VVSGYFDTYSDDFIPIFYNLNGVGFQPWCGTRANFYSLQYVPRMWWGDEDGGSSSGPWEADILARRDVPTDVTIDIIAYRGGTDFDIRASVCVESGGIGKDMRIYVVQILDYYPSYPSYSRNAFRQVATEDVYVAAGACADVQKFMTLKAEDLAQSADIGVVVWAQDPLNSGPAEIFQTAYLFDTPGISADGFESGDLSAWD
jgi:hypothetical protein